MRNVQEWPSMNSYKIHEIKTNFLKFVLIIGCDYPAVPFRRIIRYPAEPVQEVPPDYLLSGGTIAMSGFRWIIRYPAERFL